MKIKEIPYNYQFLLSLITMEIKAEPILEKIQKHFKVLKKLNLTIWMSWKRIWNKKRVLRRNPTITGHTN